MLQLLDTELAGAGQGAWRLVFGHYPLYSGGHYYGSNTMRRLMEDILEDNKVTSEVTLSCFSLKTAIRWISTSRATTITSSTGPGARGRGRGWST